jgi:hypothetical protein
MMKIANSDFQITRTETNAVSEDRSEAPEFSQPGLSGSLNRVLLK